MQLYEKCKHALHYLTTLRGKKGRRGGGEQGVEKKTKRSPSLGSTICPAKGDPQYVRAQSLVEIHAGPVL